MTVQELFGMVRDVVGQSVETTPDDGLFLYVSDWQDATVKWVLPNGDLIDGFVTTVEPDGDDQCIWLNIVYSYGETPMLFETWLTDTEVEFVGKS